MASPKIVVLLGMHRSGTSLTASILQALGVDFGTDFIPANESNPKGYFENAAISQLHIRLNRLLNRRPFTPAGLAEYPEDFWQSRQALDAVDELEMLVGRELENARGLWGFKDPHTIKFLPLWQVLFERLGIEPVFILAVRHPSEVAASAASRDHIDPGQGELMWIDHNVAALHGTGFNIPVVTDYAAWFSDPLPQAQRILNALGLAWPAGEARLQAVLNERIGPALHRQKQSGDTLLPLAQELYQQLLAVVSGVSLRQATEQLVDSYLASKQLFGPSLNMLEHEYGRYQAKNRELECLRQEKDRELWALKVQLKKLERMVSAVTAARPIALVRQYQVLRMRVAGKPAENAPLIKLQRLLDKE